MHRPEQALHQNIAKYLDACLGGAAWWTTFPAGGGGQMRGKILKGIGLKKGVPDILIIDGGHAVWLELKAPKTGHARDSQKACHAALKVARSDVAIVRSLEEAEAALDGWCIPLRARLSPCLRDGKNES